MERNEAHWNAIMQELTGTDAKVWEKLNERDTYLTAEESLKLNLATEIFWARKKYMQNDLTKQEQVASQELQKQFQDMLIEVKRKMKSNSKNELIRIISALLLDNYTLKMQLAQKEEKNETTV